MSWADDICKSHDGFVHTGQNCLMCVEDAALVRARIKEARRIRDAVTELRKTLWAYKSHEAMAMVLDDVLKAIDGV